MVGEVTGEGGWGRVVGLAVFFFASVVIGLWLYSGALDGAFISDDTFFVVDLAENHELDGRFVAAALNPWSELKYEVMNYAPLYVLCSRIESAVFGQRTYGFHVVNVVLHALNATLLVAVVRQLGMGMLVAGVAGAFFLVHPACVEAVAWVSQLRSILALACGLGAILALRRYPLLATALFVAALLFKVAALFALPLAIALAWCGRGGEGRRRISWFWVSIWAVCFALYAYPQFSAWGYFGEGPASRYADSAEHLRSMAEIGVRYLLMAATSIGVSAFQEPEPTRSWLDPWWLAALPIAAVVLWRMVVTLARREEEGAWWLAAAAAYAPISQITPFYFAMGDRYLYFVLPPLIVATLLAIGGARASNHPLSPSLPRRGDHGESDRRGRAMWAAIAAMGLALPIFTARTMARAELWTTQVPLAREGAANFPNGGLAHWLRTVELISRGDVSGGLREFEGVIDRGYHQYVSLFGLPELKPFHQHPELVALRERLARMEIEKFARRGAPSQRQARMVATAHFFLRDYEAALQTFEAALQMDGPYHDKIQAEIAIVREALEQSKKARP